MENNNTNPQNSGQNHSSHPEHKHGEHGHETENKDHNHESHQSHETHEQHKAHHDSVGKDGVELPKDRSRMVKIALIGASVLVLVGLVYSFKGFFVLAMVNGEFISRHAVVSELERQGGRDTLDNLINKALIQSEASSKKIAVTDEEINNEIKKFEDQFAAVGQNIDEVLKMENLTRDELKEQVAVRIQIEKLVADKSSIGDEELNKYITDSQITLPAGQEEQTKAQIREQMKQEKLATLSQELLTELRNKAKIYDFSNYTGGSQAQQ